jgi:hypothetical protein
VAEWKKSMSRVEFLAWTEFYKAHPFDDRHRFHRPAALIAGSSGDDVEKCLDWLQPRRSAEDDQHTDADRDLFAAAGVKLRGA